ncbi:palmitoyltransferase zdhhc15 [Limosa lapponica baueri]|uniref:Palmitoyltransferase zdhhc15 n=1 Tax=Limosa lapponica baueri TaxID=1758121 RepID=A0A2I0UGK8_LIMLA|nr:palmitoyltransferase zdhhc15 [Limosa lapponica baueri]
MGSLYRRWKETRKHHKTGRSSREHGPERFKPSNEDTISAARDWMLTSYNLLMEKVVTPENNECQGKKLVCTSGVASTKMLANAQSIGYRSSYSSVYICLFISESEWLDRVTQVKECCRIYSVKTLVPGISYEANRDPFKMGEKEILHMMSSRAVELAKGHCGCYKLMEVSEETEQAHEREAY